MADFSNTEARTDVMGAVNLFEYFCLRTSEDMRSRGAEGETPATSFASLAVTFLIAVAFFIFGKPQLAKATFVLFGMLFLWTAWGIVIRSSEQIDQKASSIRAGVFPPDSSPLVLARLKWWSHLVTPLHWGRHSRLFDRRSKLDRRITDLEKRIAEAVAADPAAPPNPVPGEEAVGELADRINNQQERLAYEAALPPVKDGLPRFQAEIALYLALRLKIDAMAEQLERIEKLNVVFESFSPEDLSQVVSEAIQSLEERRFLVASVDRINPDDFIDLVTVQTA